MNTYLFVILLSRNNYKPQKKKRISCSMADNRGTSHRHLDMFYAEKKPCNQAKQEHYTKQSKNTRKH